MIRKFFIVFIAMILIGITVAPAFAQVGRNSLCPVMPGEQSKDKFSVDYKGERIYLCCKACVKAFKRNPEKYIGNFRRE